MELVSILTFEAWQVVLHWCGKDYVAKKTASVIAVTQKLEVSNKTLSRYSHLSYHKFKHETINSFSIRPTLKSCSFPIHRLREIKNSHEAPAGRKFFLQSLCLKRYIIKRFKKISNWYKKMLLCICLYPIFVVIHCNLIMMIDINQRPVLCPHTNKTN